MNGKLTVDQKARAVEIALAGESPLPYLKEIGMKNPSASWQYIKSVLKSTNPDRWAQLPERLPKNIETPETPITIKAEDICGTVVEMPEKVTFTRLTDLPEIPEKEDRYSRNLFSKYQITAIRHPDLGEFYYDKKYDSLDWRTDDGDEIRMGPGMWKKLMEDLPEIFTELGLGVEL